jgi:hypothetical protein
MFELGIEIKKNLFNGSLEKQRKSFKDDCLNQQTNIKKEIIVL